MDNKELLLRPYQREMAETILKNYYEQNNTLLSVAVGTGRIVTISWALDQLFEQSRIRAVLILTPVSILRDQFVSILNQHISKKAYILRVDKTSKSFFVETSQPPLIAVSTLSMFRKNDVFTRSGFFDLIIIDECDRLSNKDWSKLQRLQSPLTAITSIHPIRINKKIFSALEKRVPDYSYGISSIRLRDLADVKKGAKYSTKQLLTKGKVKFFRPRDIKRNGFLETETFIAEDVARKLSKSSLKSGDIVLQNIFSFGKMAIVREQDLPAVASQNLFIIRSKTIPADILFNHLRSKAIADTFRKQLESISHGATILRISLKDVKEIAVPLPFSLEQLWNFANINRYEDIRALKNLRNELLHLRKAYKEFSGIEE